MLKKPVFGGSTRSRFFMFRRKRTANPSEAKRGENGFCLGKRSMLRGFSRDDSNINKEFYREIVNFQKFEKIIFHLSKKYATAIEAVPCSQNVDKKFCFFSSDKGQGAPAVLKNGLRKFYIRKDKGFEAFLLEMNRTNVLKI